MNTASLITALSAATGLPEPMVGKLLSRPKEFAHGDLALPCFILSKEWKLSPPECAKKLQADLKLPSTVAKAEVAGPYLNFYFERGAAVKEVLGQILREGPRYGSGTPTKKKVVIEYSSPNIAKPFHVGHLRTTLIGHSLDLTYRFRGYEVVSLNHLGDWGTQFGFVYAGCALWGKPENPDIEELVDLYRKASLLRKAQDENTVAPEDKDKPDANKLARDYFLRLEAGDPEAVAFWKWVLDISVNYLKSTYEKLGVRFDHYLGESFFRDKLGDVEASLRSSGILTDSEGALGVDLGKKLGFVRVFAEDGRSLYITRDLATADYRYKTFNPEKILIVVASQQNHYFQQLSEVLVRMKHPLAGKNIHISYGMIPGIKTRSGGGDDRVWLRALIEEAEERALEAYRAQVEKRPEGSDEHEIAHAVALAAVFFNFLCRSNIKDFHFKWEDAMSFQGDTGPYLLYAHARLNSIEVKAKTEGLTPSDTFDPSALVDDRAYELIALLDRFPEVVQRAEEDYEPYHIAQYLLDLGRAFSSAYRDLRVIGEEKKIAEARLVLFKGIRTVIKTGLSLIGIPAIDRM